MDTEETINNEEILQRINETVSWCQHRIDIHEPRTCLRTPELKPLAYEIKAEDYIKFHAHKYEHAQVSLTDLTQKRRELLYRENLEQSMVSFSPANGRLMLHVLSYSLDDGLSEYCSAGFFDVIDMPPWDTWIACLKTSELHSGWNMILSWVPLEFCAIANDGMLCDALDCVFWASEHRQKNFHAKFLDWLESRELLF